MTDTLPRDLDTVRTNGTATAVRDRAAPPGRGLDEPVVLPDHIEPATGTATTDPASSTGRLPFFPALEGLRGVAVLGVLVFHGGFAVAQGGFLGVSTFFTLSGFLITALLLSEHGATGHVDLRRFWSHRFRRLLPAALATLVLVVVFGALAADALQRQRLGGDLLASAGYVANWRFVVSGQSYGDLFGAPSPVLHFWSLAIEEQYYVLYPLLAYAILRVLRWSRARFAAVLGVLVVGSLLAGVAFSSSFDRVYYGTDTRAAELLVGALLAVAVSGRDGRRLTRVARGRVRGARVMMVAGVVALVAIVALWVTTPHNAPWLARGGFAAYAVVSSALVLASLLPGGPIARLFSRRALRFLGRISYGVYLYHWPIFLWLDEENTGFAGLALWIYRVAVTLVLAWLSYRYLELPVREGRRVLPWFGPAAWGVVIAAVVVTAAFVVSATAPAPANDFVTAQLRLEAQTRRAAPDPGTGGATGVGTGGRTATGPGTTPAGALPPRPRLAIFGDSTMLATGLGLGDVLTASGDAEPVGGHTELGCGLGRGGERKSGGGVEPVPERCDDWPAQWAATIDALQPDVVVVAEGPWDVEERRLPGDDTWRAPGDPVYDAYLLREMHTAVDTLSARGARVVWLTSPPVGPNVAKSGQPELAQLDHPERTARFNDLLRATQADRPDTMRVVDLAGWLAASGEDDRLRPDGVHLGDEQSRDVARRWLAAEVMRAARGGDGPEGA